MSMWSNIKRLLGIKTKKAYWHDDCLFRQNTGELISVVGFRNHPHVSGPVSIKQWVVIWNDIDYGSPRFASKDSAMAWAARGYEVAPTPENLSPLKWVV